MKILLLQGANMVALGKRQPELYGTTTAAQLDAMLVEEAKNLGVSLDIRYTNVEGEAIDWIYQAEASGIAAQERMTPRIARTARALWTIYFLLTMACAMGYWAAGNAEGPDLLRALRLSRPPHQRPRLRSHLRPLSEIPLSPRLPTTPLRDRGRGPLVPGSAFGSDRGSQRPSLMA